MGVCWPSHVCDNFNCQIGTQAESRQDHGFSRSNKDQFNNNKFNKCKDSVICLQWVNGGLTRPDNNGFGSLHKDHHHGLNDTDVVIDVFEMKVVVEDC